MPPDPGGLRGRPHGATAAHGVRAIRPLDLVARGPVGCEDEKI
jgi:hypothetical protein